jgi:hypothetical protein
MIFKKLQVYCNYNLLIINVLYPYSKIKTHVL